MGSLSNLYISQSYQSLIHLGTNNTASATLIGLEDGLGNSIGVSVNTAGNLFLSGTFSASLQEGYLYVGNASGRTIAFPTSSLVTNINTGSLVTTSSFNAYTASTDIRLSNIEIATASILVSISNLNASSASQQISIDALNVFTASQSTASIVSSITQLNVFTQSANIRLNNLETTSASVNTSLSNINAYTQSNDVKWQDLGNKSGSWITESETGSFARYDVSNPWSADQTFTNITATSASFTYVKTIFETASVIYSSGSNQLGDELTDVQTLSGSVLVRGGLFVNDIDVTSSLNSINVFTQSANIRLSNLETTSASVNISISNLNTFTASISTASIVNSITNLNQFTQSANIRLNNLESTSASVNTSITNINLFTQSADQRLDSIEAQSGSWVTSAITGSSIITASVSDDDITFTKGDGSTFTIQVATGSFALSASFAETASLAINALTASIARNLIVIARNGGASTLSAGTVVHITSAVGDNPIFTTASYDTEALSGNTFGLLRYSSPSGADVEVVVAGVVTGVDTDPTLGYTAGDIIYLSSSGQFTKVQPQAPNQIVTLGQVLRAQQNNGSIYVSINNGWELEELHNVQINNVQTGDLIQYESSSYGLWKNKSIVGAGITTTSSFNSYTSSNDQRVSSLEANSASVNTSITNLNSFTASQSTASLVTSIDNLNNFSASALISISNLNASSASQQISIDALNTNSASVNTSITNINSATASLFASASLALVTASFDNGTRNLTFTKGDTTTFNVNIPDVSGSAGDFVTTSSFNAYTQSNDQRVGSLESNSASVNISISNINVFTQSADQRLDSIEAATSSYVTESESGSFLITGSVAGNVLTFTKGDNTTFNLTVATGSGGSIDTGSFATTGSNTFFGSETFNIGLSDEFRVNWGSASSASLYTENSGGPNQTLNLTSASLYINRGGLFFSSGSFTVQTGDMQFNSYPSASFTIRTQYGGDAVLRSNSDFTNNSLPYAYFKATPNGGAEIIGFGNNVVISGSATTIQGVDFIPFSASLDTRINSITGSATNTGSLLVTASYSLGTITFTKGDGSTFPLSSFASLGANQFTGNQEILNNSKLIFGNGFQLSGNATDIAQLSSATTIQFITEPPAGPGGTNDIKFINRVTGSSIIFQNQQGGAGNSIEFEAGAVNFNIGARSGSTGKVVFGSNTVSIDASNSTFTASLQQGYAWVGNAGGVSVAVPTSSFTGSGGGTTYINPTLNPYSGSLILAANLTTTSSFSHITASNNGQVNLMFQNRNLTGQIYITGSSNIFSNPNVPSAGRLNYLGGSSNILLTSFTANNTQQFPTLTGSAATIGGVYPAMNGNILMSQGAWTINPSNNPGIHNYNNNILNGSTTFNMVGNVQTTGVANTGRFEFTGNTSAGTILINSPSRSIAEINAGATGSFRLIMTNNNIAGGLTYNGPVSGSAANIHNITQNIVAGTVTMNVQSGSKGYTVSGNSINGTVVINDNTAFTPTLGSGVSYTNNIINGNPSFNTRNSSSFAIANNSINTWNISSDADLSAITSGVLRTISLNANALFGTTNNNILFSGSAAAIAVNKQLQSNLMSGNNISASVGGGEQALIATTVLGRGLNVFGTNIWNATNTTVGGADAGSLFAGRWNSLDGNRALSAETIFAVGTGNSGSAGITRKTGFLIDSGSNTFIEGTLNVSGASTLNGNTIITGSLTLSSSAAIELDVIGNSQFTGSLTVSGSTTVTGSLSLSNVISFAQLDPLPTGADGQLAVSASNLWFYSGSAWNRVAFA